ncbi:hypothetical protein DPM13_01185 [Paracoccus mutanolyticus]|uniref:D-galactarate/Altronate dehydratase C-terminal domain-containing protein n=1 Tax=Paracoccus mutanolyticus TaxID=1499308 RepID=A0ABM6WUN6_9RHOB|nr:UxaA family hydrolase [Paracoccus mutanolyticus]AWX94338.1 hypothetical protein DPM13_01185 [Paracoccus mutanolyticus]
MDVAGARCARRHVREGRSHAPNYPPTEPHRARCDLPSSGRGLPPPPAPSMTRQRSTGCETGRGSVFGSKPVPTVKLATNSPMYRHMADDMDINCGTILDGEAWGRVTPDEAMRRWPVPEDLLDSRQPAVEERGAADRSLAEQDSDSAAT